MTSITCAQTAWKLLHGFFPVFKPRDMSLTKTSKLLKKYLCEDLNSLIVRKPRAIDMPITTTNTEGDTYEIGSERVMDYADHCLVVGKRYQMEDIRLRPLNHLETDSAGVLVYGINDACDNPFRKLKKARHMKIYRITGRFGRATIDLKESGKIVEKTTYKHLVPYRIQKVLSKIQAQHQKVSFDFAGLDIQSQRAYELASKGIIRPREDSPALLLDMKLICLNLPYFTVVVHAVNENDTYLRESIHEIGLLLRTTACTAKITRIRDGPFTLSDSLLEKHWTLENVLNSISHYNLLLENESLLQTSPSYLALPEKDFQAPECIPSDVHSTIYNSPQPSIASECDWIEDGNVPLLDLHKSKLKIRRVQLPFWG